MSIHRFWIGSPRPQHTWITAVVHNMYSSVIDWTWDNLPSDLTSQLSISDDPRHLSNCIRYWILREYGGLYLDYDVIPLKDLTRVPNAWTASLRGHREGGIMWFPNPGHQMLTDVLSVALTSPPISSPIRSGARLLHQIGLNYPEIAYEPRVIPIDAFGRSTGVLDVWAVSQWQTSSRNLCDTK